MGHFDNARQSSNRSFMAASHGAVADGVFRFLILQLHGPNQRLPASVLGSINRQNLQDYVFQSRPKAGPFASIKLFHNWLSWLPGREGEVRMDVENMSSSLLWRLKTLGA